MNQLALRSKFNEVFKKEKLYFFAPGRVNLIGEHTDYNGGHVFPCALSFGTHCVFCKRDDKKIRLYSLNFPEKGIIDADLSAISYDKKQDWANYPLGVIKTLQNHGYNINQGFELMFWGDIPNGAGLSSSASIELATAVAMNKVFNLYIPQVELVKFCQEAENKFVGMNWHYGPVCYRYGQRGLRGAFGLQYAKLRICPAGFKGRVYRNYEHQ